MQGRYVYLYCLSPSCSSLDIAKVINRSNGSCVAFTTVRAQPFDNAATRSDFER